MLYGCDVAYFSMEVALDPGMPTYSGGLGVLAGDTLRAAADLGVRMAGVSLLAALNGVPSLSVLDGWWLEGCVEGVTGWSIGPRDRSPERKEN